VWLCLEHHDEYDGSTSQSKGLTAAEVRHYRNRLHTEMDAIGPEPIAKRDRTERPWHYPLWQVANQPEMFAYTVPGGMDGVCLIERINIPDGRIVVACMQVAGNPGRSITNSIEHICAQICARFAIPADRTVWLEYYDEPHYGEWKLVTFKKILLSCNFSCPIWTPLTESMWKNLGLRPKSKIVRKGLHYFSPIAKQLDWPTEAISE